MADTKVPVLTFNNGLTMPQLGYGTWKVSSKLYYINLMIL